MNEHQDLRDPQAHSILFRDTPKGQMYMHASKSWHRALAWPGYVLSLSLKCRSDEVWFISFVTGLDAGLMAYGDSIAFAELSVGQ